MKIISDAEIDVLKAMADTPKGRVLVGEIQHFGAMTALGLASLTALTEQTLATNVGAAAALGALSLMSKHLRRGLLGDVPADTELDETLSGSTSRRRLAP
jgi:hypothetical protein